ncbi:MAG: hypothetical protein COA32_17595 [Fluviicola sp.]|nr:MAG: hypothetical protein COA32_17595 [Fluviicola sp.]
MSACKTFSNCEDKDNYSYHNKYLIDEEIKGEKIVISTRDSIDYVMIKWENGFFSLGSLIHQSEFGKWMTFDKKQRIRKEVLFGYKGKFVLSYKEYNKKGEVIKSGYSSVPFN